MIDNDNDMVMVYRNCIVMVIVMMLIEIVIKSITLLCTTIERHEAARSHLQEHFHDWQMVKIGKQNNQLLAWTCERVIEVNLPLTLRQSCVSV